MAPSRNPYDAPAAVAQPNAALPEWARPIMRASFVVIALDFARGAAWRLFSIAAPASFGDRFNPNVVIQLAFAVAMVFAVSSLVRRHDGAVVAAPMLRVVCIGSAIAAVSMFVTRLVVDAVVGTSASASLGVASIAFDGITVILAALYLAAVLAKLHAGETSRRVRTLVGVYAVALAAALVVVANTARPHGFLPPGTGSPLRSLATLVFMALGVIAYRSLASLVRR